MQNVNYLYVSFTNTMTFQSYCTLHLALRQNTEERGFHRPDAASVAQPAASKHYRISCFTTIFPKRVTMTTFLCRPIDEITKSYSEKNGHCIKHSEMFVFWSVPYIWKTERMLQCNECMLSVYWGKGNAISSAICLKSGVRYHQLQKEYQHIPIKLCVNCICSL